MCRSSLPNTPALVVLIGFRGSEVTRSPGTRVTQPA